MSREKKQASPTSSAVPDSKPVAELALFRRLLKYVLAYPGVFCVALASMIISAATDPIFASLMKPLVDVNFVSRDKQEILRVPLLIVALVGVRGIASFVNEYSMAWLSSRVVFDLRNLMFDRLLTLPTSYYDQHPAGKLMSRILYDVAQVTQAGANLVTVLVKDSLTIIGLLGYLIYMDWRLTIVCVFALPVVAISIRVAGRRLRGLSRQSQEAMGDVTQVIEESIHCQRVIKVFGGQSQEADKFQERNNALRLFNVKQTSASSANSALIQWIVSLALAAIIYMASLRSMNGGLTAGEFVAYMAAMLMLFGPIKRLTSVNVAMQKGLAAAESVFALLDEPAEVNEGRTPIKRAKGELVFEGATFRYPRAKRDALHDINLRIAPGEKIAFVGTSGSGKTTLANLIPRFYDLKSGRILLDGVALQDMTLAELRANVALVSQDVTLFNDTLSANIAYGVQSDAGEDAVLAAAQAAHALDFIRETPDGFKTLVGDKGVRLSGGQKQRIAIARALLKDAPILILDEATSALDNESEKIVQAALERLMQGRTTLIVAHRLSTIQNADRIVVMQHGCIVEMGSHTELLEKNGAYATLWQMQFKQPHVAMTPDPINQTQVTDA